MFLVFWFKGGGSRSIKVDDKHEARKIMEACQGEEELFIDEPATLIIMNNVNYVSIETMKELTQYDTLEAVKRRSLLDIILGR